MAILDTLPAFAGYFVTALGLFGLFIHLYIRLTPYHELELIRAGNCAAASALLGTALGFVLPLASSIANSTSLGDMLVWGILAMLIQALAYLVIARLLPELKSGIEAGHMAYGLLLGGAALCIGLLNAACIVY